METERIALPRSVRQLCKDSGMDLEAIQKTIDDACESDNDNGKHRRELVKKLGILCKSDEAAIYDEQLIVEMAENGERYRDFEAFAEDVFGVKYDSWLDFWQYVDIEGLLVEAPGVVVAQNGEEINHYSQEIWHFDA